MTNHRELFEFNHAEQPLETGSAAAIGEYA